MNNIIQLSKEDKTFFSLVSSAIRANPFSDERNIINSKIADLPITTPYLKLITKVIEVVNHKINSLEKHRKANVNNYKDDDKEIMNSVFLFEFFHKFIEDFDNFIFDQIKAGDRAIKITFADKAFNFLGKRGIVGEDADYYFALCFQIRRAYYFIVHYLIGKSNCMKELRKRLWNNIFTFDIDLYNKYLLNKMEDFSTLILGETGTGKGAAAFAIGRSGFIPYDSKNQCFKESFNKSFISINLSQYPENLIESELFGHKKGAFTGATEDYKGILKLCSRYGAIFIDEIGEVSIPIQIKLLKVFQERIFNPVGSHEKIKFEGRIIAATNKDIKTIRNQKKFRDDFFYRLCSDIIEVPPLRQRINEDIEELYDLIKYLIKRIIGSESEELVNIVKDVILKNLGSNYTWPGNVRELEQCIRSILLKRDYKSVLFEKNQESDFINKIEKGTINVEELIKNYCKKLYSKYKSYQDVSNITGLDWRTVKKYIVN